MQKKKNCMFKQKTHSKSLRNYEARKNATTKFNTKQRKQLQKNSNN